MINLKEAILECCFERYDGNFSNGEQANNKLDLDKLPKNPELRQRCIRLLGSLAALKGVDFVTAVPNGANWIARDVAEQYEIPLVQLVKYPDTKGIDFRTQDDEDLATELSSGLLIEDVSRTFYNIRKCLSLESLGGKIMIIGSIFDRGDSDHRQPASVPLHALARQYIPPILSEDSPLWRYADGQN